MNNLTVNEAKPKKKKKNKYLGLVLQGGIGSGKTSLIEAACNTQGLEVLSSSIFF